MRSLHLYISPDTLKALRQASVLVDWYFFCSHLGERRRLTSSLLNQCYLEYDRLGDSVIGANNSREFETAKLTLSKRESGKI